MATVYLAIARGASGFGRAVAVKRIHPHLASEREFVEMFLDEARIASRIRHPNVCSVEDFGEAICLDSNLASAYAGWGLAHTLLG